MWNIKKKTAKEVKMHNFLVCACKSQDFAQSQKICARSHDRETVSFRNSELAVSSPPPVLHSLHPDTPPSQIYLDAKELTRQISEYTKMSRIWPNKYQNIVGVPKCDQTNILIYLDRVKATNINTCNINRPFILE